MVDENRNSCIDEKLVGDTNFDVCRNSFEIRNSGLIGSKEAIKELENKKAARILVLSDTHGFIDIFQQAILAFGVDCDALVFCGDGLCDLEQTIGDSRFAMSFPPVIAYAAGNCDIGTRTIPICEKTVFKAAGHAFFIVHGHRYSVDYGTDTLCTAALSASACAAFYGHTHKTRIEYNREIMMLNPGSLSRPRGGTEQSLSVVTVLKESNQCKADFFKLSGNLYRGNPSVSDNGRNISYSFEPYNISQNNTVGW